MNVMMANQPNTTAVPKANTNPRKFLFLKALIKAKIASMATKPKMITNPILFTSPGIIK
jgi:hypothetical protein